MFRVFYWLHACLPSLLGPCADLSFTNPDGHQLPTGAVSIFFLLEMDMTNQTDTTSQASANPVASQSSQGNVSNSQNQAALADKAFDDYNFGEGVTVTDTGNWEYRDPGHERNRKVYVETEREDDGPAPRWTLNFNVRFNEDDGSLAEAYALDQRGQPWGQMPAQEQQGNELLLQSHGYFAGERDVKVKPEFPGRFMVRDPQDEDGFCIVGDDLNALVLEALGHLEIAPLEVQGIVQDDDAEASIQDVIGDALDRSEKYGFSVSKANAVEVIRESANVLNIQLTDTQTRQASDRLLQELDTSCDREESPSLGM